MANLPLAFGEILVGAIILDAGVKGDSIANVVQGKATQHGLPGGSTTATGPGTATPGGPVPAGHYVNPFPGAQTGRIDQGVDYTAKQFLSPGRAKVLVANQTDAGWGGGGYLALELLDGPLKGSIVYMAEGIAPLVQVGETVAAGQAVAKPVTNPYNGTVGNIEAGWANPHSPGQPLAQTFTGYGGDQSTQALTAGYSFSQFVHALGGVAGVFQGAGQSLAATIRHDFSGHVQGVPYG